MVRPDPVVFNTALFPGPGNSSTAHYWARELRALGHEVRLMPAQYVKAYIKRNKHDSGCHSGKRYRICRGRQMNVHELDQNGVQIAVWCFGPEGCLPVSDIMLAQKIALETDEHAALAVANRCR